MKDLIENHFPALFKLLYGKEVHQVWLVSERMYPFSMAIRSEMMKQGELESSVTIKVSKSVTMPDGEKEIKANNMCMVTQYSKGLLCEPWVREQWLSATLAEAK